MKQWIKTVLLTANQNAWLFLTVVSIIEQVYEALLLFGCLWLVATYLTIVELNKEKKING